MLDGLAAGQVVQGRYRLERQLGEGGMGVVWSAKHEITNKRVALKILKTPGVDVRRRFLREARLASAIRHPNVVDVHDVLELESGEPFMVMDLLEGESLADRLEREGSLTLDEVARVTLPVLSAVSAAHSMGIVHRDLKPENIFLSRGSAAEPEPTVQVLDFGIAKLTMLDGALSHTTGLTQTGSVLGTPTYMAPEQVFGEKSIDHRADVWALGVILYECLAGACPIEGDNVGQIFKSISQHTFQPIEKRLTSLPRSVARVVDRMLSHDPAARPTLREVAEALGRETGRPLPLIDVSPLSRAVDGDTPAGPFSKRDTATAGATTMIAPVAGPPRRVRAFGIAIALSVTAVVGFALTRREPPPSGAPSSATSALVEDGSRAPVLAVTASGPEVAPSSAPKPSVTMDERQKPIATSRPSPAASSSGHAVASSAAPVQSADPRSLGGVHVASPY